ncbi:hypothetical protein GBF38_004739 [Nibea albiflora]|uniref:Uncharacterized protein n=1 Tax=Nibea albiflora TaxID=240163 RepID=A0ACB7FEK0_NIBAL|nr:hypothetical protein GBF38_004739 [Nibea albiflora]
MDDSLKGKNREGLLDSPDSGLPPSPSPPFCSLSPGLIESRSGSCTTPVESHHGCYKKESREGKLKMPQQSCRFLHHQLRPSRGSADQIQISNLGGPGTPGGPRWDCEVTGSFQCVVIGLSLVRLQ